MTDDMAWAGPAVNCLFKIGVTVYEMIAVTEQAHDLLDSANHVSSSVETVRSLRRQKSGLLQAEEKIWIDRVVYDTEKTLKNVASLVEPARVDMQTKSGKIGLVNRARFVFRDSPKVATNFARLTLTSQSLNTALTMLSSRDGTHSGVAQHRQSSGPLLSPISSLTQEASPLPPSYQESEYLNRKRLSRSNPSSVSLREIFIPAPSLVVPPIPFDTKPTILEPVLTSLSELQDDQSSRRRSHASPSDDRCEDNGHLHTGIHSDALGLSIPCPIGPIRRSKSRDRHQFFLVPQDLPYPFAESQDSQWWEMPEQKQYEHHNISAYHSMSPPYPPYPTYEFGIPRSPHLSLGHQTINTTFAELPCGEPDTPMSRHSQIEMPVCLQPGQRREPEAFVENSSTQTSTLQRSLTARERRKQWYTDNAV
jgi:hypothetical protein